MSVGVDWAMVEDSVVAIARGHGLDERALLEAWGDAVGPLEHGERLEADEVHMRRMRIKRCERALGWFCESEGEWHTHWLDVHPKPDGSSAMTIIRRCEAVDG